MIRNLLLLTNLVLFGTSISKYQASNVQIGSSVVTMNLKYTGQDEYYVKPTSKIIKDLIFTLQVYSFDDFDLKIQDTEKMRYTVPQEGVFPIDPLRNFTYPLNLSAINFEYTADPFDFRIIRKHTNAILFSTYDIELIFSDYYIQIGTQVETDYTYGIGQRFNRGFRLKQGKWTIFNRDRGQQIDDGEGRQTYGYYPVYLQKQREEYFHVNYFRSSHAMDVIKQSKNKKYYLTYKVIGGIIDFRFFLGEQNATWALNKFHLYLGRSAIPPFWAMGFHQCRWGYKNVTYLENVIKGFEDNGLPLDTIWSDIDYMIDYEDFTIDETRFPLDAMNKIISKYHYIPIIDAGIKVNNGTAYIEGKKRGVFVKDANGKEQRGKVWPGPTTFVDFLHPNATQYWSDMLDVLYQKVPFSGVWLDMNEYANFCDGPCQQPIGPSRFDYSNDLPYVPGTGSETIESKTIPLNATHYGNQTQAQVHAFSGFLETHATNVFLRSKNLRPFIIARSSTLGSNKYGFHWTGDNYASFQFLKGSISDNFINQMWGLQMVGPDICGFGGNTNVQLCSRWFQLATVYPFTRDHNDAQHKSQQPYALGDTVLQAAKTNLKLRYSLLKHIYSMLILRRGLGSIFSPLFHEYPHDENVYIDEIADTEILIGNNLLAAPIVVEGKTSRNVYFPGDKWVNLHTKVIYESGTSILRDISLTDPLPLFLKAGSAIFMQNVDNVTKTKDLGNAFHLVAALSDSHLSNSAFNYYYASGAHISISDYNNEVKISDCLSQGCSYYFSILFGENKIVFQKDILKMSVNYAGGFKLDEVIVINEVSLYGKKSIYKRLDEPIEIRGSGQYDIPISNRVQDKHLTDQ